MKDAEVSILIVEDELPIRSLLLDVFSSRFKCWAADSASSAVRLMEARFFHLALVDSGLPGMSGISLCRLIGNMSPQTLVVIVSGNTDSESMNDAMKAGAAEYVTKPFHLSHVLSVVERSLERRFPSSAA